MKVIDAERAIREALAEGGARFAELGLSTEGAVLFSDAKFMQCEPEESKYMTAVLAIRAAIDKNMTEADEDESVEIESDDEAEDEDSEAGVYEIDFGFDVKNGEIADGEVESAILTFFEDCDEVKAELEEADDLGAKLDELSRANEAEYMALLGKLKKIKIGFLAAAGLLALVVILALIL